MQRETNGLLEEKDSSVYVKCQNMGRVSVLFLKEKGEEKNLKL